jgi:membrane AbrB-like protein
VDAGRRRLIDLAVVVAGAVLLSLALAVLGAPSPTLFGGLVAGLVRALASRGRVTVPARATAAAQAVIGVTVGALVDPETLGAVASNWLPVLLVTLATLALSLAAGLLLRLQRGISPVTSAFSMIAGGASGIIAMARELGADERMVAVLQYLRVLLIVALMPVVATVAYGAPVSGDGAGSLAGPGWAAGLLFTVGCAVVGLVAGTQVPGPVADPAFLVIGLQVGLSFTRESLRTIGRALPMALVAIVGLIVASAGLGAVLAATTGASALDGYLATTPGGLYAVLATASGSGADVTFVLAVQVLRLVVMLLSAPMVARWLRRPSAG